MHQIPTWFFPLHPCPSPHLEGWVGQGWLEGIGMKASSSLWRPSRTPGLATQASATISGGTTRGLSLYYCIKEIKNDNTLGLPHPTGKKKSEPLEYLGETLFLFETRKGWHTLLRFANLNQDWEMIKSMIIRSEMICTIFRRLHSSLSTAISPSKINSNPYVRRSSYITHKAQACEVSIMLSAYDLFYLLNKVMVSSMN